MLPWVLLAAVLTVGAAGGTGYWKGNQHATARIEAQLLREAEKTRVDQAEALQAAAAEIAKIDVKHQTLKQVVQREVVEVPVYRECRHSPDTLSAVNAALAPPDAN